MDIRACLCEIKFNLVGKNRINDSDEFAGTVPKDIVMSPTLRHPGIVVSLEGGGVLNHFVCSIFQV